jgi:hypothetical protein
MEPDPSTPAPVVKWSEQWWANVSPEVQAHRCTAHSSRTGERCKRAGINGGTIGGNHGGRAPQGESRVAGLKAPRPWPDGTGPRQFPRRGRTRLADGASRPSVWNVPAGPSLRPGWPRPTWPSFPRSAQVVHPHTLAPDLGQRHVELLPEKLVVQMAPAVGRSEQLCLGAVFDVGVQVVLDLGASVGAPPPSGAAPFRAC